MFRNLICYFCSGLSKNLFVLPKEAGDFYIANAEMLVSAMVYPARFHVFVVLLGVYLYFVQSTTETIDYDVVVLLFCKNIMIRGLFIYTCFPTL